MYFNIIWMYFNIIWMYYNASMFVYMIIQMEFPMLFVLDWSPRMDPEYPIPDPTGKLYSWSWNGKQPPPGPPHTSATSRRIQGKRRTANSCKSSRVMFLHPVCVLENLCMNLHHINEVFCYIVIIIHLYVHYAMFSYTWFSSGLLVFT